MSTLIVVGLVLSTVLWSAGSGGAAGYEPAVRLTDHSLERVTPSVTQPGQVGEAVSLPQGATAGWWASVERDISRSEYQVTWQDRTNLPDLPAESPRFGIGAAYHAPNRAQDLRTYFTPTGIRVIPRTGDGASWEWGFTLAGFGYEGAVQPVDPATLSAEDNRIEYRRGDLTEWYVNDEQGLEQGFTIAAPPVRRPGGEGAEYLVLELALTGDLSPSLTEDGRAIELTTEGGVRVLRYGSLYAEDAAGRRLPAYLAVGSAGISVLVDDNSAIYPIIVDPLVTSPSWTAESDQADAHFGYSVGTAGDVNSDGYSDVIVGAVFYDSGEIWEGRAFVYHGSATGLSATANWSAEGDQFGALFGSSVGTAGDVNGDGYSDVIVGAEQFDSGETNEGGAFVYHGSATGLNATADWTAEGDQAEANFGSSVGTAGDVNGDGYFDVIVGADRYDNAESDEGRAYAYHGSATGLNATADWTAEANFGSSVGTAGDVNGDGYSDIIVGAKQFDSGETNEGGAFVYQGSATGLNATADWTAEGDQAEANFGSSVGTAGDVNGDGYSDVIVGADRYDNAETDEGRAFVYHGSATGVSATADWTAEGDQAGAFFGDSVGTAGDVNGDGYSDVIVGAIRYSRVEFNEGRAFVYQGSATGPSATADWTADSDQVGAGFGVSVGMAGDVNGDGYSDVIVGAYEYDGGETNEGRAFVFHGLATGLGATADWTAESDQVGAGFGVSVGMAGDVNGDGYSDVIVGAYEYDGGETNEGRAFVFHGSATGLGATADWTAESNQAFAFFGRSVGRAGDVNGDGYSDVIIGAYLYDSGETDEGRAFVYHGSATGLRATADWTAESNQASAPVGPALLPSSPHFGWSVGTAGDVNGDGYSDVIVGASGYDSGETDEGGAFVYHGVESPSADLSIAKRDSPDSVLAGNSLTYALTVTNDGPSDATGATVTDTLPVGVTFISVTPAQGSCSRTSTITCSLDGLASNASTTVTIQVKVNSSTIGTITNTASVSGNEADPQDTNNTASEDTAVVAEADLSITKSDSADPVVAGAALSYTLNVTNAGPSDATGVTFTDTLPSEMTFASSAPGSPTCTELDGTVTCDLGNMSVASSSAVTIVAVAATLGTMTNTASVTGAEDDPDPENNAVSEDTEVMPGADLRVTKWGRLASSFLFRMLRLASTQLRS